MSSRPRLVLAALVAFGLANAAAAEGVLDRLRETGEIRLGVRVDAAPLSWLQGDKPAGYSVLVCNGVVAELGTALGRELTATWVTVDADTRFDAVASGEIDLLCGAATITLERRARVDFSLPTFVDGAAVLLPRDADPEFAALEGERVGVREGTTTEASLRASLQALGIEAEVVTFDNHQAALTALEDGEIAAYFGDQSILFGLFFASDMADTLVVSENMLTIEKHGLALPRGDDDFRLAVDTAISTLFRDGRMEAYFKESFPGATPGMALRALFLLGPDMP
jgi:polar amino acid transport system substrate-binding protein/glutamate/aspartate transport system substrate-binding protein